MKYPIDLTGTLDFNLVLEERQNISTDAQTPYGVVELRAGGFYTRSLKVYDNTLRRLEPLVDYVVSYKHKVASEMTGLEICSTVVLFPHVTGFVYLTAQVVGGNYAKSETAIADTFAWLKTLQEVPEWAGFYGNEKNSGYDVTDPERWRLAGFEPLNAELENVTFAILNGSGDAENNYRRRIANLGDHFRPLMDAAQSAINNHVNDFNDPHKTTAAKLGIVNLRNYGQANEAASIAGTSNTLYMNPKGFHALLQEKAIKRIQQHADDQNNPHEDSLAGLNVMPLTDFARLLSGKMFNAAYSHSLVDSNGGVVPPALFNNIIASNSHNVYDIRLADAIALLRVNLNAANFSGSVDPKYVGRGNASSNTILTGDRNWTNIESLANMYSPDYLVSIYGAGNYATLQEGEANIDVTFGDFNAYPTGTIVSFSYNVFQKYGYGNGGNSITHQPQCFRIRTSPGVWYTVGY